MSTKPPLVLQNQYGEVSENTVIEDTEEYDGSGSYQMFGPDMYLAAGAGSNDPGDPKFIATIMGNIFGATLTKVANFLAGVIGAYSITGTKSSRWPSGGVIGIISDGVTDVDGAVVAHIDGDSALTVANAAFKATMKNTTPNSGFNYGLDLYQAGVDGYPALNIVKAALRLNNQVCVMTGATAPVSGASGTGDNFAGPGSIYVAIDTGFVWQQTGLITSPVWTLLGLTQPLTGLAAGTNTAIGATDTLLVALAKLQAQIDAL